MARLLILALDRDSRAGAAVAADLVRQLPRDQYTCAFVTAPGRASHVHDLGYPALALDHGSAQANRDAADRMVSTFRPDRILIADEPALRASSGWSGLDVATLRERHAVPFVCLDRYGRGAAAVNVDGYGEPPHLLPGLSDQCDLVLRCAPPYRAKTDADGAIPVALTGAGLRGAAAAVPPPERPRRPGAPTVFISEPAEQAIPAGPARGLAAALPHIMHDHLAALDRPLRIVHVGGTAWDFPILDRLEYSHLTMAPPALHRDRMLAADLYLSANVASMALCEAVLSGVPALVLHQPDEVVVSGPDAQAPGWLADAAPQLTRLYPFRAFPWGWYRLLTDALRDNPYGDCFLSAALVDRPAVLAAAATLLDDGEARSALYERQLGYRTELAALRTAADVLWSAVSR